MQDTATTTKLIDRVRKLLALAERAGTPEEAGTALANAQKIIAENALSMEQVHQAQMRADATRKDEPIVQRIVYVAKSSQCQTWIGVLVYAIAQANGCEVIWGRARGPKARELNAPHGVDEVAYIKAYGRASDLEIVEELSRIVTGQVDELARRSGWEGRTALNSFRLGACNTICDRLRAATQAARKALEAAAEEQNAMAPESARQVTALALRSLDDRQARASAALRSENKVRTHTTRSRVNHDARSDGQRAGGRVSLSSARAIGGGR